MTMTAWLFLLILQTEALFEADAGHGDPDAKKMEQTAAILKKRFEKAGLPPADVEIVDGKKIRIRAKASADQWDQIKKLAARRGRVELSEVADEETTRKASAANWKLDDPAWKFLDNPEKRENPPSAVSYDKIAIKSEPAVTTRDIRAAVAEKSGFGDSWQVNFSLTEDGSKRFFEATKSLSERNPRGHIAIVLDGKVVSAPVVHSAIRDAGVISGNYTAAEARQLAVVLNSGMLPYPLTLLEEK